MQWSDNERKKEIFYRKPKVNEMQVMNSLAWENSTHFATHH